MVKVRYDRLERLADRLEKVKRSHFDISTWYEAPSKKIAKIEKTKSLKYNFGGGFGKREVLIREGFCGSVACVLGHAALIDDFNDKGLYVDVTEAIDDVKYYKGGKSIELTADVVYKDRDGIHYGAEAGIRFFGLPKVHAYIMFFYNAPLECCQFYGVDMEDQITPKKVAKALRKYIETKGESIKPFVESYKEY